MNLHTLCYFPETPTEQVDPTIGLTDLRKGLCTIALGYVLCVAAILAAGGVLWYVVMNIKESGISGQVLEHASTILFATALLFYLGLIGSLILVVRGKWMCLMCAPENNHAKWFMFAAILCIVTGPALNRCSILLSDSDPPSTPAKGRKTGAADIVRAYEDYKPALPDLNTRGYVRLAGQGIGLLSSVFFVLFLRAVALSWGNLTLARFTELFLFLACLLAAAVVALVCKPAIFLARPALLLGLAGGWLLCGLWYFGLILGTIASISGSLQKYR